MENSIAWEEAYSAKETFKRDGEKIQESNIYISSQSPSVPLHSTVRCSRSFYLKLNEHGPDGLAAAVDEAAADDAVSDDDGGNDDE